MVMSQVLINDTTLTSIADAIREKNMSNPEYMKVTETITMNVQNAPDYQQRIYYFPFNSVKKVRFKAHIYNTTDLDLPQMPILLTAGWYSFYNNYRDNPDAIVINPNNQPGETSDYDGIFEGNSIGLITQYTTFRYRHAYLDVEVTALDENGQEIGRYSPSEMADAIKAPSQKQTLMIQGYLQNNNTDEYLNLTAEDFKGVTRIRSNAFQDLNNLKRIEIPEGIYTIGANAFYNDYSLETDLLLLPSTLKSIGSNAFKGCSKISAFKILNKDSVITWDDDNPRFENSKTVYIPSCLYQQYMEHQYWNGTNNLNLVPYGEWVFDPKISVTLEFNQSKSFTIELIDFKTAPTFSITSSDQNIITVSNIVINDDNTAITFDVNSLTTEGNATINISIQGQEMSFDFTSNFKVVEEITEAYEVVAVENASYGFQLNSNGYYYSKNKGVSNSYAICQVNIKNKNGKKVYFDCINSGENNYDFGILSKVNTALSLSSSEDSNSSYFKSFKGQSSTNVQTVEYTDAVDGCFIQVKYIKDSSGDQGNDTLQFKVRFEE